MNIALWLGLRGLLIFWLFEQVLRLAIEIALGLLLGASVAANSSSKVVVLALTADPATVWESTVLLFPFVRAAAFELRNNLGFLAFFLLLVLGPLERPHMEAVVFLLIRLFLNFGLHGGLISFACLAEVVRFS